MKTKFKKGDRVYFVRMKFFWCGDEEVCKYEMVKGIVDSYLSDRINLGMAVFVIKNRKKQKSFISPNAMDDVFFTEAEAKKRMKELRKDTVKWLKKKVDTFAKAAKKLERMINEN